mmetsp:Transcript_35679/g.80331  ORF Transcript_35679/g.80331 Transcript_35679/m.80331 type:complete len:92 (+) Transcript_35679:2071-2346(+)
MMRRHTSQFCGEKSVPNGSAVWRKRKSATMIEKAGITSGCNLSWRKQLPEKAATVIIPVSREIATRKQSGPEDARTFLHRLHGRQCPEMGT